LRSAVTGILLASDLFTTIGFENLA